MQADILLQCRDQCISHPHNFNVSMLTNCDIFGIIHQAIRGRARRAPPTLLSSLRRHAPRRRRHRRWARTCCRRGPASAGAATLRWLPHTTPRLAVTPTSQRARLAYRLPAGRSRDSCLPWCEARVLICIVATIGHGQHVAEGHSPYLQVGSCCDHCVQTELDRVPCYWRRPSAERALLLLTGGRGTDSCFGRTPARTPRCRSSRPRT